MTNREKLIDLLTEKDGEVDIKSFADFLGAFACEICPCECHRRGSCERHFAKWLNKEAKE